MHCSFFFFFYSSIETNMARHTVYNIVFVSRKTGKNWKNNNGKPVILLTMSMEINIWNCWLLIFLNNAQNKCQDRARITAWLQQWLPLYGSPTAQRPSHKNNTHTHANTRLCSAYIWYLRSMASLWFVFLFFFIFSYILGFKKKRFFLFFFFISKLNPWDQCSCVAAHVWL